MLLRKHVQGAKIAAVVQPAVERMLTIELDTTDEMGVACKKHLICELMGKHSNVILCGEDNRIIDAMRRKPAGGSIEADLNGKDMVFGFAPLRETETSSAMLAIGMPRAAVLANVDHQSRRNLEVALAAIALALFSAWMLAYVSQVRPTERLWR